VRVLRFLQSVNDKCRPLEYVLPIGHEAASEAARRAARHDHSRTASMASGSSSL
jgi:hypothetical protein